MAQKRICFVALLAVLFCTCAVSSFASYTAVSVFGTEGAITTDIAGYDDVATGMVVQDDGKIVVVGTASNGTDTDIVVARYTTSGTLDTTFNSSGSATFQVGSGDDEGYGIAILDDGSFLVTGAAEDSEGLVDVVVLKLTSSGLLDTDFGIAGTAIFALDDLSAEGFAIAVDTDGNGVVAATVTSDDDSWAAALRFTSEGELDDSFGDSGWRLIDKGEESSAKALAFDAEGRILLAGMVEDTENLQQAALFCLDTDGNIDTDFGSSGVVSVSAYDEDSSFLALAVLADSGIAAVGSRQTDGVSGLLVAQFSWAGTLDTDFGTSGLQTFDYGYDADAAGLVELSDGTLLLAGSRGSADGVDALLLQLDELGTLADSTVIDIAGEDDAACAIAVSSDAATVYLAGETSNGVSTDIALLAYSMDGTRTATESSSTKTSSSSSGVSITTISVTNIQSTSAMSGGVITSTSSSVTVSERGVVYSLAPYPSYGTEYDDDDSDSDDDAVFPSWVGSAAGYSLVSGGQTSEGSGTGSYGSIISSLTPKKTYYVRAYAVLSDSTIIYGGQLSFKTDDACFIATAAFGSMLEPQVRILRTFRDRFLETNAPGRYFVNTYYQHSPRIADTIRDSRPLRSITRILLIPVILLSSFMVFCPLPGKILFILAVCSLAYRRKLLWKKMQEGETCS